MASTTPPEVASDGDNDSLTSSEMADEDHFEATDSDSDLPPTISIYNIVMTSWNDEGDYEKSNRITFREDGAGGHTAHFRCGSFRATFEW